MPYKVSWYQPDRIILSEFDGILTIDEVRAYVQQCYEMIDSGQPLVHSIIDVRGLKKIESVPDSLKAVQTTPTHPNSGWTIVVGSLNPLVTFVVDFMGMITKSRYRRFDSVPEAIDFMKERDQTLVTL